MLTDSKNNKLQDGWSDNLRTNLTLKLSWSNWIIWANQVQMLKYVKHRKQMSTQRPVGARRTMLHRFTRARQNGLEFDGQEQLAGQIYMQF